MQYHKGMERLPFDGVGVADDGTVGHRRVAVDDIFNFCRAEAVPRYIDDVIDPAYDSVRPVGISASPISGEVPAFIG